MITSDNYESTHRYITIKKIPFQNKNNSRNEIKFERNSLNKSVILASKNSIKYIDDKYSYQDNDTKINVKTNSVNNNNNLESQNQNHHSFQNNEHNLNINSQFLGKLNLLKVFGLSNKNNKEKDNSIYNLKINQNCLICNDELTESEKKNNFLDCHHILCSSCYYEYLKENINSINVIDIKCPAKDCNEILYNNFIEKLLINDIPLLNKYKKFVNRRQLILNPNIQLCPFPDCESYAKKGKNKYVTCIHNNHKFCFKCLKDWHGEKECINELNIKFDHWRNPYKIKKCPKCKYYIEKNGGCNHIKCFNCKYQFCWLCRNEYSEIHYQKGICAGLQFSNFYCHSIKIFLYLRKIVIVILKSLAFIIFFPFAFVFLIYAKLYYIITDKENDFVILWGLSGVFSCFVFVAILFCLANIIAILMIFWWPLQDKIYDLICK